MLINIARFEIRYLLRNPLLWITGALTFAMVFFSMNLEGWELGSEGGLLRNAAYATLRNALMFSVMFMFVTTAFVANAVIRDDETGYGPIMRSTPITKFEYLFGRYLGAFATAAFLLLAVPLASLLGSLMPWASPELLGPNRLADHLYAYFLLALPNIFLHSSVFFTLATITRSMMATYLGVVSFVAGFFTLEGALKRPQLEMAVAVAEPFAARAVSDATRYWTIAERNELLPPLTGALLYNRLLWMSVAVLCLALAFARYRSADQGMSRRDRRKQRNILPEVREEVVRAPEEQQLPSPTHGAAAMRVLLWMRTKFEAKQVIKSPAFPVLMAWGVYTTVFVLLTQRYPDYRPEYPTTMSLIPEIEDSFRIIPMIVAIYYAGELVWRERDRRVHELIDASPLPSWAYVIPKTAALALVFVAMLLVTVVAAVALQLSLGFTDLELSKYMLWYVLPASFDSLLLAAVAIFVQSLSPHKAVGWGIMTLFLAWQEWNGMSRVIHHNLLNYGETPGVPLSDFNGAGTFWGGAWTLRLYWGALAMLLLVAAHLLWRRGTEIRLKPRVRLAVRRLSGVAGLVAGATLVTFLATGAYAYYNTNVLNEYQTKEQDEAEIAEYEKRFGKYSDLPQPSLEELTVNVAVHPEDRRAVTRGRYLLRNRTEQPISEFHIRLLERSDMELTSITLDGAHLVLDDARFDYRIYHLDRPMQPGETRSLTFETDRWQRGFDNYSPDTKIVSNGTFLTAFDLLPVLGMDDSGLHQDPATRRKYGLPGEIRPPALEDTEAAMKQSFPNGWIRKMDITLSTDAAETPVAPGNRVSDVTQGGRRTARFVTTAPTRLRFSIQSARYAEKRRTHDGVELVVLYHPRHAWNVDRMLDAMAGSLDYYKASFGPYQFDHFRIVEFPAYAGYAQAFAGTIAFSESVGFIADYTDPTTIDYVSGITAHEFAHQWWPGQIVAAETEGYSVLVETLAQYSAHMVMKQLRGEDQIRRFRQFELDRYLAGRAGAKSEPPLARALGQDYLAYRKGAMVMYLLQKRLGEETVNRALRNLLERYRFKGAPYPRTIELIAALRAEAKTDEQQALITDLFERVTLYDMKVDKPSAVRRADGRWNVTVPIEAKKVYVDATGEETATPIEERIEIGIFTAAPGRHAFDASSAILFERHPIRSGRQVLKFVVDKQPAFAGIDPYTFYIDRNARDNVAPVVR